MRLINLASCIAATAIGILPVTGYANTTAKEPLSIELVSYKVITNIKGEAEYQPATQAKPDDIIEYRATYTNNTGKPIKGLVATLPIPPETQFLAKSSPAQAQASTDGVNFAAMPLKRKVGGQTVNVPLQEYRALRWTVAELPAGKSVVVTAQTRVSSVPAAGK
jgi:uncharacterized repeat protein (TIGR01451 family)